MKLDEIKEAHRESLDDFPVKCGTYCQGGTPNWGGITDAATAITQRAEIEARIEELELLDEKITSMKEYGVTLKIKDRLSQLREQLKELE